MYLSVKDTLYQSIIIFILLYIHTVYINCDVCELAGLRHSSFSKSLARVRLRDTFNHEQLMKHDWKRREQWTVLLARMMFRTLFALPNILCVLNIINYIRYLLLASRKFAYKNALVGRP